MPLKFKKTPTQEELKEFFTYNPETGELLRCDGYIGRINHWGYLIFNFGSVDYYSHRLIWKFVTGEEPVQIDHINGDRTDNRWSNLRNVNHLENGRNQRKKKDNTSGYTGVSYHQSNNKYQAYLTIKGKYIQIGSYNCATRAHFERISYLKEYHPTLFHTNHGT